jgi:hypothetical protein
MNPAGIDIADGAFLRDLRLRDNDWVDVEYLWSPGGAIDTTRSRAPAPQPEPDRRDEPVRTESPRRAPSRTHAILSDILDLTQIVLEQSRRRN